MSNEERQRGRVKWFDSKKGIGFIQRDGASDVFVHFSQIIGWDYKTLHRGQEVEFTERQGKRGPVAADVITV
jgi:CspA family cold shock protein